MTGYNFVVVYMFPQAADCLTRLGSLMVSLVPPAGPLCSSALVLTPCGGLTGSLYLSVLLSVLSLKIVNADKQENCFIFAVFSSHGF